MNLSEIGPGPNPPSDIYVVVEIPAGGPPVKYEMHKSSGALFVDRFLHTAMFYPGNYGFIPGTLSEDGDPCDVLVITPVPVLPGSVIRCRPITALIMTDQAGQDEKIVAVPVDALQPAHNAGRPHDELPQILLDQISHFFEHYKDLDKDKWTKIGGWLDSKGAERLITEAIARASHA